MFCGIAVDSHSEHYREAVARHPSSGSKQIIDLGPLTVLTAGEPADFEAIHVVFDGCLHNSRALKARLQLPETTPVGVVVARGLAEHGTRFLGLLRGAYHLLVWNRQTDEISLATDHLGARALFYSAFSRCIAFADDIVNLDPLLPYALAPDPDVVPRWITDRSLPQGVTLYRGVKRIPTGRVLTVGELRHTLAPAWEPSYRETREVSQIDEAAAILREATRAAVHRDLPTTKRCGILLSGGFDSATIAALARDQVGSKESLRAYSAVFPGAPWDESEAARLLVDAYGLPSTQLRVSSGTLATALAFQRRWTLPQPAPGAILDGPLLRQASHDGVSVMLDGQGGDELFAASPYLLTDLVLKARLGAAWKLAHHFPQTGRHLARWQMQALLKQIVFRGGLPYEFHRLNPGGSEYRQLSWLTPSSRHLAESLDDPWAWKRRTGSAPRWWAYLAYLIVDSRETSGMQDFLRRRGELAGVDSRQPFLTDVDLVETVLETPPQYAFAPEHDRALARFAMRGIVPDEVRLPARKSRYGALMRTTLAGEELPALRRILEAPDAEIGAYVDLARVRDDLLDKPPSGADAPTSGWERYTWSLATTEMWLRSFTMGERYDGWLESLALEPLRVQTIVAQPPVGS